MIDTPPVEFKTTFEQGSARGAAKQADATSTDMLMVPIDKLVIVPGLNVRIRTPDYEVHIESLKNSILQHGFYKHQPLGGYAAKEGDQDFIYVTHGFSRLEGAKRARAAGASLEKLPVVLRPPGTSIEDLTIALANDNTGRPLSPFERAIVVKRLLSFGMTEDEIAVKMHITQQYVKDLLFLMSLPAALRNRVIAGSESASNMVALARKVGVKACLEAYGGKQDEGADPGAPSAMPSGRPAAARKATVPKKTLLNLIDYVLSIPNGLSFLKRWRSGDEDAAAEIQAWKPPRKAPRKAPKPKAKKAAEIQAWKPPRKAPKPKAKKAAGKRGRKKATHALAAFLRPGTPALAALRPATPAPADDPFDTTTPSAPEDDEL
jgi:ParB-like chromosome segregation protein Spo0J